MRTDKGTIRAGKETNRVGQDFQCCLIFQQILRYKNIIKTKNSYETKISELLFIWCKHTIW